MTRSDPGAVHLHSVGCTAEIRQISRQEDGMLNIVAKGKASAVRICAILDLVATLAAVLYSKGNLQLHQLRMSLHLQIQLDTDTIPSNRI